MSLVVTKRVWKHSHHRGAIKLLLLALAEFANESNICWPSASTLAALINEDVRYTRILLRKLITAGDLVAIPGGGRGRTTTYGVAIGLDDRQRQRLNSDLQNTVLQNTDLLETVYSSDENSVLPCQETVYYSDGPEAPNSAPERAEVAFSAGGIRHVDPSHDPDLSNGGGIQTRARANGTSRPPPPSRADQDLPQGIAQSAAEWLNHPLKTAERRQLLTLLGAYGADWLDAGIAASVAQGGRSLNYLTALLEGCRRDDRPPGSPKTHEQRNGTHHNAIGNRQPARAHSERARWSETDLDQPL